MICWLNVGCEVPNLSAARVNEPSSTTVPQAFSLRVSTAEPPLASCTARRSSEERRGLSLRIWVDRLSVEPDPFSGRVEHHPSADLLNKPRRRRYRTPGSKFPSRLSELPRSSGAGY